MKSWVLSVAFMAAMSAQAAPVVYSFEQLADSEALTTQLSGLSFTHSTALQQGISLNEFDFPPRSGSTVLFDDGGAIEINFLSGPVASVGAYFNYGTQLSLTAFDASGNQLGSLASLFSNNLATSGDAGSASNEFLNFSSASPLISRVVIEGDVSGGSFTLDDLTVDAGDPIAPVPEPESIALFAMLFGGLGLLKLTGAPRRRAAARTL